MQLHRPLIAAHTLSVLFGTPAMADAQAGSPSQCIRSDQIRSTQTPEDKAIEFLMKDGSSYRSQLAGPCPGLSIGGFVYTDQQTETICGHQPIRALWSGALCMLGPITREAATAP